MSSMNLIGQKVGEYEVIRRIGIGGMGAVFEGKHPLIGKRVAIKVLLPQFSEDESLVRRFLAEARAVNEIRHRGIVDIFAFGELPDGSHYFVMEFLEGSSFEALLKARRVLPPGEALALMEEVLDAVSAAHQAGVVHRDLKPSNLFLVDVGRGRPFVKLLDFGVAKLTQRTDSPGQSEATGIVGTPIYMSPEQINGGRVVPQTDLYALGVVLFELLTGRPPFEASTPVEMMSRHVDARPPRVSEVKAGLPLELDRLVDKMLMKKPSERPHDAESLRAEIARIKSQLDAPAARVANANGGQPLEDDIGPTLIRAAPTAPPGTTSRDMPPVRAGRRLGTDPDRTRVNVGPTLPWGGDDMPTTTLDGEGGEASLPPGRHKEEDEEFDQPPTVLEPRDRVGPVPKSTNSQSAPTLMGATPVEDRARATARAVMLEPTEPLGAHVAEKSAERAPPLLGRPPPRLNPAHPVEATSPPVRAWSPWSLLVAAVGMLAAAAALAAWLKH